MIFDTKDISKIVDAINENLNAQCEKDFAKWKESIMRSVHTTLPDGLPEKMSIFCDSQKHLFFRDYKQRLFNKIKNYNYEKIEVPVKVDECLNFIDQKNQTFLEAYFLNKRNQSAAAKSLGIPRSTYNDWVKENYEMILSHDAQSIKNRNSIYELPKQNT